jgi:hypothetical protein
MIFFKVSKLDLDLWMFVDVIWLKAFCFGVLVHTDLTDVLQRQRNNFDFIPLLRLAPSGICSHLQLHSGCSESGSETGFSWLKLLADYLFKEVLKNTVMSSKSQFSRDSLFWSSSAGMLPGVDWMTDWLTDWLTVRITHSYVSILPFWYQYSLI